VIEKVASPLSNQHTSEQEAYRLCSSAQFNCSNRRELHARSGCAAVLTAQLEIISHIPFMLTWSKQ